jgi:hypothetical protein
MLLLRDAESDQVFRIVGGEIDGAAEPDPLGVHPTASVRVSVQASVAASQIPKLSADDMVEVTIDRLLSD